MNGQGGHRAGAGRKKGSKNVVDERLVAAKAEARAIKRQSVKFARSVTESDTPLEVLLQMMLKWRDMADELDAPGSPSSVHVEMDDNGKTVARLTPTALRQMACEAAKSAAPYMHARLSTVEASVKVSAYEASLLELAAEDVAGG